VAELVAGDDLEDGADRRVERVLERLAGFDRGEGLTDAAFAEERRDDVRDAGSIERALNRQRPGSDAARGGLRHDREQGCVELPGPPMDRMARC
jgi:hypothetical protein